MSPRMNSTTLSVTILSVIILVGSRGSNSLSSAIFGLCSFRLYILNTIGVHLAPRVRLFASISPSASIAFLLLKSHSASPRPTGGPN